MCGGKFGCRLGSWPGDSALAIRTISVVPCEPWLGAPLLVALTVGAVVGAAVGAIMGADVRGREDRIVSMILGALSAAVVASLSWIPILVWRIVEIGGP